MRIIQAVVFSFSLLFAAVSCDPAPTSETKTETKTTTKTSSGSQAAATNTDTPALDKQIRLNAGSSNLVTDDTTWLLSKFETYHLIKFNKANYPGLKSAVFSPSLYISDGSATVTAELFNITDNVPIAGSRVNSNKTDYVFVDSENILDALPDKEVTLGIRFKSSRRAKTARTGLVSYLFLNR